MRSFGTNRLSGIGFAPGPEAGEWPSPWGSVSFCVQNRLREKSGHGKRLIDEIDLLTKEQSHDHPNQA